MFLRIKSGWKELGPKETVEDLVASARESLSSQSLDAVENLAALASFLKFSSGILQAPKTLIIMPDGVLHGVPFSALNIALRNTCL